MDVNKFIALVAPGAISARKKYGILASVTIAQAAVESGWGSHAPGNNLFGIKANGWKGRVVNLLTGEYIKGKYIKITAAFRAYNSWTESVTDHAAFLVANKRYKNILGQKNFKTACVNLQADGYSTSPYYSQTLVSIIEAHGLAKYDAK